VVSSKDWTSFSHAVEKGYESVVRLLLARGDIEVNSLDWSSRTSLSYATENGHERMVTLLSVHDDIEPNSKDWRG